MNIDPTTGLPELPEGYFWRIAEIKSDYTTTIYYRAQIMYTITRATTPERKHWWSFQKPSPEVVVTEHVRAYGTVQDAVKVAKRAENKAAWEAEHGTNEDYGFYHSGGYIATEASLLTKGDVLTAAKLALDKWEAAKDAKLKKAASDALLGDYPPKVLA